MAGLYYEEFAVGMEFRHAVTRTVTEMDNVMFCAALLRLTQLTSTRRVRI